MEIHLRKTSTVLSRIKKFDQQIPLFLVGKSSKHPLLFGLELVGGAVLVNRIDHLCDLFELLFVEVQHFGVLQGLSVEVRSPANKELFQVVINRPAPAPAL